MPRRRAAHDVFISYASVDRDAAEAICGALERDDIRCWIAPRDGTPGASYAAFLVDAIAASRAVVVVFSHSANRSDAVLNELEIAANRKRPIVPVRIEAVEPRGAAEFYLRRPQWVDAAPPLSGSLPAVVAAVKTALRAARPRRPAATAGAAPLTPPPRRGNLPLPVTSFVGRDRDRNEVIALLGTCRVMTLWGTGGAGKTRLAIEVARAVEPDYADGVWFFDLAAVTDEGGVAPAIAATLGLREEAGTPLVDTLVNGLGAKTSLLILDNCEHVLAAAAGVAARVLAAAPGARILCTSREPLGIAGEHVHAVGPLGADAVELFVQRAAAAGVTYADPAAGETIAAICRRIDGIPFAVELAAARTRSMSLNEIAESLDARFRLLTGGNRNAPARQQTLRAALDWSYGLLDDIQRRYFARAAVFLGGWTGAAFRAIAADDGEAWEAMDALGALIDKSLVEHDPATSRYRQLETTREYAAELLRAGGGEEPIRRRHAEYTLAQVRDAVRAWRETGSDAPLRALLADRDNATAALGWALFERNDVLIGGRLAAALGIVWEFSGAYQTGFAALEAARAALPPDAPEADAARLELAIAGLSQRRNEPERALEHARRAVQLAAGCGDMASEARALWLIGQSLRRSGDLSGAEVTLRRALEAYRELSDRRGITACLGELAFVAGQRGDHAEARRAYGEIVETVEASGDVWTASWALLNLAEFAFADGDVADAIAMSRRILECAATEGLTDIVPFVIRNLASYLLADGALGEARLQLARLADVLESDGSRTLLTEAVLALALAEARSGRTDEARALVALAGGVAPDDARTFDPAETYVRRELAAVLGTVPARDGVPPADIIARMRAVLQGPTATRARGASTLR